MNGNGTSIICTSGQATSKGFEIYAADQNKNEAKFEFQGLSSISQRWFDLDFDWTEVNFSTRVPDFYKKISKSMTIHKIQIHLKDFKLQ